MAKRLICTGCFFVGMVMFLGCAAPRKPPATGAAGQPDLVPIPKIFSFSPLSVSFCQRDGEGNLVITVRNQGGGEALPSMTRVSFGAAGTFTLATSALSPTFSENLKQPIPAGCFNPDCNFTITVDSGNQVSESEEANNTVSDLCIG